MGKWNDCRTKFPRKRKVGRTELSDSVLVYSDGFHSIAFYDYSKKKWKDITVNSYIDDMDGKWMYAPIPSFSNNLLKFKQSGESHGR